MAAPKEKDFGKLEPQVSSFVPSPEPGELTSIDSDESRGGKNPAPIVIMEGEKHRSAFKKEKEHTAEPVYYTERGK